MTGTQRVRYRLSAVVLTVVTLMIAGRVLDGLAGVMGGFLVPLLISLVLVAVLTWVIGSKLAGGHLLVGVASAVFVAPYLFVIFALPSDPTPKAAPSGHDLAHWELSTGRTITTYLYDQAGVGWSPLTDESAYTVAASVADLEAIRRILGADELIVAGHSWGGSLATHYATKHEDHVAALLLSAPGLFSGPVGDRRGPNLTASAATTSLQFREPLPLGLRSVERLAPWGMPALRRLLTQEVEAAIVQDWLDPSFALARGVCAGDDPGPVPALMRNSNYNLTANRLISRDLRSIEPNNNLAELNVPVLIVRGVCDYVPWSVHRHYRDSLPGAQLVVVEDVGHRSRVIEPMLNFLATGDSGWFDYRGNEFPIDDGS